MLLPGPEAQQLAIYIGWLLHRTLGGLVAGGLFVLPGIVAIMALSYVYAAYGNVPLIVALFFGLKAAVLAIVLEAVVRIGRRALKNNAMLGARRSGVRRHLLLRRAVSADHSRRGADRLSRRAAADCARVPGRQRSRRRSKQRRRRGRKSPRRGAAGARAADRCAGAAGIAPSGSRCGSCRSSCCLSALGRADVFSQIAVFFSKMAVVTFGGAYAVLAYVAQQAVENYGWLKPGEMLDGLGMAETTPGPLIMVLQFVGFMAAFRDPGALPPMLAGTLGGLLATWVTFVPCFLWIFLGAPYIEALRGNQALTGALSAITAAVVGVILNLAVWFALHTVFREVRPVRGYGLRFDTPSAEQRRTCGRSRCRSRRWSRSSASRWE